MRTWVNFCLDPLKDRDVAEILERQQNRSLFIRHAIRFYDSQPTSADLLEAIKDIEAEVRRLRISGVSGSGVGEPKPGCSEDEPLQAATNLDGLLDRLGEGSIG